MGPAILRRDLDRALECFARVIPHAVVIGQFEDSKEHEPALHESIRRLRFSTLGLRVFLLAQRRFTLAQLNYARALAQRIAEHLQIAILRDGGRRDQQKKSNVKLDAHASGLRNASRAKGYYGVAEVLTNTTAQGHRSQGLTGRDARNLG
jgi:hypothetical protein